MRRRTAIVFAAIFTSSATLACDAEHEEHGHECPADAPEISAFVVAPTTVAAGAEFTVMASIENFELAGHDEGETGDHEGEDECAGGHYHVYLDDFMTNPLAMPETAEATILMPEGTELGEHILYARLHNRDHTILTPEVVAEAMITVE